MNGTTYRWLLPVLILLVVLNIGPARADDAVVATCDEPSFDTALATVQGTGGGTITFTCSGTIPITATKTITTAVTIDGGGVITLDALSASGIFVVDAAGALTLQNITLTNADDSAVVVNGSLTATNMTFAGNATAVSGGAIFVNGGTASITNSTFVNNAAGTNGGAIANSGTVNVANSVFWNNGEDCNGTLDTSGVNYFGDTTGCTLNVVSGSNVVGTDPQLTTLYQGALIPRSTSPLIDAAVDCSVSDDQFGTARPQGADCEVGAVERPDILASPAAPAVGEDGTTDILTFTLAAEPFAAVSFDLDTDGQCFVDGVMTTTVTVTTANWDTGAAVTVSAVDDGDIEGAHTCAITINPASSTDLRYDNTDPADLTADITDNDIAPGISILDAETQEGDSGTTNLVFQLQRTGNLTVESSVDWATADDSAIAGSDYNTNSGTVTFLEDDDLAEITIELIGDTIFEADETFFVDLSNPVNAEIVDAQAVGTITNDDAEPSLVIDDVSQNEGDAGTTTFTFTVTLNNATGDPVSVDWTTTDSTANAGSDYVAANGTLNFSGATTTQNIDITVNGDTALEDDEAFFVDLINVTGTAVIGDDRGIGTIINDDPLPTISIADATVDETDSATVVTLTLSRGGDTSVASSVQVDTADDSATAGDDYTAVTAQIVNFGVGVGTQTIDIDISGDDVFEGDEQFFVNLSNPTLATISDAQAVVTITDDETQPTVSIDDVSVVEGDSGTVNATLTVSLSGQSAQSVSFNWQTADATATAGDDYTAISGSASIGPLNTSLTIDVPVLGDTIFEGDETFEVNLSGLVNATFADDQGIVTITDDETQPSISIDDVSVVEGDSGTVNATLTISLSGQSAQPVSVDWATADDTATAGSDYTTSGGTANFDPLATTQTITVPVIGDTDDEGNEQFFVNLSNPVNATISDNQGVVTITDDDGALPVIGFDPVDSVIVSTGEGNSGTSSVTLTVQRTGDTSGFSSVTFATADGTATGGDDYVTITPNVLDFPAGVATRTIQVDIIGDTLDEPDESFTVNLSGVFGATLDEATSTITIVDDDATPTISIDDVSQNEGDAGDTIFAFTVSLSAASGQTVTVDYATQDDSATTADNDYVAATNTITFNPTQTTQVVNITVNGDTNVEPDEQFFVNLSNPTNATISDAQGVATIVNDDALAAIIVDPASLPDGTEGTAYSQTITASGGVAPYSFNVTAGALPDGLNLDSDTGVIDGTPATPNTYNFTITATDSNGDTGTRDYTVTIDPAGGVTIIVDPPTLPDGTIGTAYSQSITASGGATPYTFNVTAGNLPDGLTLAAGGLLNGEPTTANTYNFTITATDSNGDTGSRDYTVTISGALIVVNPTTLPNGAVGQNYNATFTASGGTGNYSFGVSAGTLPPGLTLDPGGLLTGAPSVANTYSFTIQAQDNFGNAGTRSYTVTITPASGGVIVISPDVLPNGVLAQPYNTTIAASGGTAPYTFSIISGSLPPGLSLVPGGQISGTPTTEGSFSFTVQASDNTGRTGQRAYTITITLTDGAATPIPGEPTPIPQPTLVPLTATVSNEVGGLAIRTGPYLGATLIGGLTPGESFTVTAQSNDEGGEFIWYYVVTENVSGWVSGRYVVFNRDPGGFPTQGSVFDTIDNAPDVGVVGRLGTFTDLRRRPSPRTFPILQQLPPGTDLVVIGRTRQNGGNFWFHVRYNGQVGWISGSLVIIRGNIEDVPIR